MGYDMTWRERDGAGPERYFYASITDMATLRGAMLKLRMAYEGYDEDDNPHPWPESTGSSVDQELARPGEPACPSCDLRLIDGVCKACEVDALWDAAAVPRRSWAPTPWLGICLDKLVGNDGYIVAAEECRYAIEAYGATTEEQRRESVLAAADEQHEPDADETILHEVVAGLGPDAELSRVEQANLQAWFEGWIEFLRGAASHGGFHVG